jgi:hypothetical protein
MSQNNSIDLNSVVLKIEHFHPHYIDESGKENVQLIETITEVIAELQQHSQIRGGYIWVENHIDFNKNNFIQVNNIVFDTGKVVYQMLKKSEQLCFFICTAGKGMSDWSRVLLDSGDFLKAYLVDLAGSLIVDLAADKLAEIIEMEAAGKGLSFSNRYSPG